VSQDRSRSFDEILTELEQWLFEAPRMADVRENATKAIRRLERGLVAAMAADQVGDLYLPNLGSDATPIVGARIRGKPFGQLDRFRPGARRPKDVESALVLASDGRLQVVTAAADGGVTWRLAEDTELKAEDLRGFARTVRYALERNLRGHDVRELATKISMLVDDLERDSR
jgi:hypothetical protein